jgi:hypothetical protein
MQPVKSILNICRLYGTSVVPAATWTEGVCQSGMENLFAVINLTVWLFVVNNLTVWLFVVNNLTLWLFVVNNLTVWLFVVNNLTVWLFAVNNLTVWLFAVNNLTVWLRNNNFVLYISSFVCEDSSKRVSDWTSTN